MKVGFGGMGWLAVVAVAMPCIAVQAQEVRHATQAETQFARTQPWTATQLKELAADYLLIANGTAKKFTADNLAKATRNAFEFRGAVLGMAVGGTAQHLYPCLSWQSQADLVFKTAQNVASQDLHPDDAASDILGVSMGFACYNPKAKP